MRSKRQIGEKIEWFSKEALVRFFVSFIIIMAGVITTYHATIYGLKCDLATKADGQVVAGMDDRLIRIEAILNERMATKAELQEARDELSRKLTNIEVKLHLLP